MSIDQALSLYKLDNATIPTNSQSLNSLVEKPQLNQFPIIGTIWIFKKNTIDPWGNDYML